MKLIVGLGNPGKEYERTRHNAGFDVMDEIARMASASITQKKFKALVDKVNIGGQSVLLMKPQTYMNNSGEAVTVEYLLSDKALTQSELAGMTFTTYSAPFSINADNEYEPT